MPVKKINTFISVILAISFGLMSFALPGNHFTPKPINGTDHLSLTPDPRTNYGIDGYFLGCLLDLLAGNPETAEEAPIKHFHFHYSYFNLQRTPLRHQARQKEAHHFCGTRTQAINILQQATPAYTTEALLPPYYNYLFRLTPF